MASSRSGFASSGRARIFFETAGSGDNMVMIHAGVADHRQWNAAFSHFQNTHTVVRYDMRGHGRSEPVAGAYRPIDDLRAVLAEAGIAGSKIMMGCSMGGSLAMDFTLTYPDEVSALIMVCSGPSGLSLDVEVPQKFAEVEQAENENDLDRVCELETQIWFDGSGRGPADVDSAARALLYDMNRLALDYENRGLGSRERDLATPAHKRLAEIGCPVMILSGALDIPFMSAAAAVMRDAIPHAYSVEFPDAAHLPNMEHPGRFNSTVEGFLKSL